MTDDLKLSHYEAVLETLLKLADKGLVDFKCFNPRPPRRAGATARLQHHNSQ